ncbi:unnamed protein product [Ceratitis capitata]|uniref:(Mediterranean fruit fly) hypothetical protein n=1 Tax=Ceratitis capitata TaxID=7213 RepID=A0A811U8X2_CERCA|nr:unnamed protein product [Ceratitis capitata]
MCCCAPLTLGLSVCTASPPSGTSPQTNTLFNGARFTCAYLSTDCRAVSWFYALFCSYSTVIRWLCARYSAFNSIIRSFVFSFLAAPNQFVHSHLIVHIYLFALLHLLLLTLCSCNLSLFGRAALFPLLAADFFGVCVTGESN